MGLYERLLKERDERRRTRRPPGYPHGLGSPVLERAVRRRGNIVGPGMLYRYLHEGAGSLGEAYRSHALKGEVSREYAEFRAERMGQSVPS